jgi:proteasome lid subunit RPN8/RPN11
MKIKQIKNRNIIENEIDWKQHIRDVHNDMADDIEYLFPNNSTEAFMTAIWKMSVDLLEKIEVMVIIDNKDDLYISSGTPSLVSFKDHEDELEIGDKMQLPLKCCIHTHPSGKAYFSKTDRKTISAWRNDIESCIVLGKNQYLAYNPKSALAKMVYYGLLENDLGGEQ